MNLPFKFALSETDLYGALWNPWGTSLPTGGVDNEILTNLNADLQERYGLLMPQGPVFITGFAIMGDTAAAKISIGIYDTELEEFHELYHIVSTVVAGGGIARTFAGSGLNLPVSATRLPMLKYTPVSGDVVVSGDLDLFVISPDVGFNPTDPSKIPQADILLTDEGAPLLTDEDMPLKVD